MSKEFSKSSKKNKISKNSRFLNDRILSANLYGQFLWFISIY